jgi:hypothetical protein
LPQAPDDVPSEVASAWFDQLYDLVKTEQITAPPASRTYSLAAVTLYEAIVPGSREHRSLVGQLNALMAVPQPARHRRYHWPTVANAALAAAIRTLLFEASPASRAAIDALDAGLRRDVSGERAGVDLHTLGGAGAGGGRGGPGLGRDRRLRGAP